jgi:hypothetical protein
VLAIVGYGLLIYGWRDFLLDMKRQPLNSALVVAGLMVELAALYFLFSKPANAWFAEPVRPAQPR